MFIWLLAAVISLTQSKFDEAGSKLEESLTKDIKFALESVYNHASQMAVDGVVTNLDMKVLESCVDKYDKARLAANQRLAIYKRAFSDEVSPELRKALSVYYAGWFKHRDDKDNTVRKFFAAVSGNDVIVFGAASELSVFLILLLFIAGPITILIGSEHNKGWLVFVGAACWIVDICFISVLFIVVQG